MKLPIAMTALALAISMTGCAKAEVKPSIVLVHGAWETSAIWGQVEAGLKADGYPVRIVELPGRPGNPMPAGQVTSLMYQQAIAAAAAQEPGKVVLVGHSFGGFGISAEAEAEPDKIKTLVYVAAYIPTDGQTLLALANTDAGSKAGPALRPNPDQGFIGIDPAQRAGLFANDAPAAVGAQVAAGIVDEPLPPLVTPIHLTAARFGSVDKVYIHTLQDHVVSPSLQASMIASTPVRLELSINTGHTPFITNPAGLVADIEQAAGAQ